MPWTEQDYPSSWKNLEEITRRKAIDMGNGMLVNGYDEDDIIPIVTEQAKEWASNATEQEKKELRNKNITEHEEDEYDHGSEYTKKDVHVQYNDEKEHWEVKTLGARQPTDTYDTKQEAKKRANEIAENRGTNVVTHKKNESTQNIDHSEEDVHVQYNNIEEHWEVKTKGAKQPTATYDTKKEAENRAQEIADNRNSSVISHTKDEDMV